MFKINKNKKAPAIASPENHPGFQVLSQCYCTYEGELIIISVNSCLIMNQKKKISKFEPFNSSFRNVCSGNNLECKQGLCTMI